MSYSKSIKKVLETMTTTSRYTPPKLKGNKPYIGDDDDTDFPYVEDPTPFVTHKAMEQKLIEQPAVPKAPVDPAADPAADPAIGAGTPTGADPTLGTDPAMAGLGADPSMGLGAGQDRDYVKLDSSELGRVYEMKKIYSRLTSVEAFLAESTDQNLIELRRGVGKAIDLFEVVITNISKFKEKIDPIIVTFYEFLDQVYSALRKYHIGQSSKER